MVERSGFDYRQARADRRAARDRLGFVNSDYRENHQFKELTFRPVSPGETNGRKVVARSAEDLVATGIYVSPDFLSEYWSPTEAKRYRDLLRAERLNGNGSNK